MPLRQSGLVILTLGLVMFQFTGCNSTCADACKQLIKTCDAGPEGWTRDQCELECEASKSILDDNDYAESEADAFQEQLNCVESAECSALNDPSDPNYPACYDASVQIYNTPSP